MAPGKPKGTGSKSSSSRPLSSQKSKISKSKAAPPKQQKSKRPEKSNTPSRGTRKKKKTYTAEELGLPQLNGIVPVGVTKPKGKKKGKVFVDDQERMMTILAMVNAEAEGKVESKIMKQRQLEEIREARRIEAEKRDSEKKGVLEDAKAQIRQKRKRKGKNPINGVGEKLVKPTEASNASRKKVSFVT